MDSGKYSHYTVEEVFKVMEEHMHIPRDAAEVLGIHVQTLYQIRKRNKEEWNELLENSFLMYEPAPMPKKEKYRPYKTREFKFNPYVTSLVDSYFKKWKTN